jgi:VanZ family protein
LYRLFGLTVALIIYGTLYPWDFHFSPRALWAWPTAWDRYVLRDMIINLFVFMPLGMTGFLAAVRNQRVWLAIAAPLLIGLLLSATVEALQIYIPGRDSSSFDILCNTVGTAIGIGLGALFEEALRPVLVRAGTFEILNPSGALLLVYCWLGYAIFPGIPALSRWALRRKLDALAWGPTVSWSVSFQTFAEWLSLGHLLSTMLGAQTLRLILPGLLLLFPVRLLLIDRTFTKPELLGSVLACIVWLLFLDRVRSRTPALALLLAISLLFSGLSPFTPTEPKHFEWLPLRASLSAQWTLSIPVLLRKVFTYGALIWFLRESGWRLGVATMAIAGLLASIEVTQYWVPGHVAETTDPLLAITIGFALHAVARPRKSWERSVAGGRIERWTRPILNETPTVALPRGHPNQPPRTYEVIGWLFVSVAIVVAIVMVWLAS